MSHGSGPMQKFSFANGANVDYLESLYAEYKRNPSGLDASWQKFFEGYDFAIRSPIAGASGEDEGARNNARVEAFINAYRRLGHLMAHLNPLAEKPVMSPEMTPERHGLKDVKADDVFHPSNLPVKEPMKFGDIMSLLLDTYCGNIGADFRELNDIEIVEWLQHEMESCRNRPQFSQQQKMRIMGKIAEAEGFERFLQMRYLGQKRFSAEGADTIIPLLDVVIDEAAKSGATEMCLGMAHRGRLNVLANIMRKDVELILKEFEGSEFNPFDIDGDVKYHMGYANEVDSASGGKLRLYLSPNPSHLEAVNPVVTGFARARQRDLNDTKRTKVIPLLIHGDASFMGQGLVAETLNFAKLEAYETGGTIHVIINNQLGFTAEPEESRSTTYSSDMAKMLRAPVLHVNADDPEAVAWCAALACRYRQKFGRDVVIDLIGYRKHGHNETDEPGYTQPLLYKTISEHPSVFTLYSQRLVKEGASTDAEIQNIANAYKDRMQKAFETVRAGKVAVLPAHPPALKKVLAYYKATPADLEKTVDTNVKINDLQSIGRKITSFPQGFTVHPKLAKLFENRAAMVANENSLVDWAFAELLAFASVAKEGHHVRLSGQDCRRGTFSSRHAVLRDFNTGAALHLLNQVGDGQQPVEVINSPLSEQGVLGFEFGYSVADPDALILWEAQFGDFVNGAQIIIDQFLVASEAKWKQCSNLVLLLPHGYEGQGPEHSSARPERFLQLCGNLNIQVAIPTTPSQYFHILRRQAVREFRKPLILMTPKSLLRHPKVQSPLVNFAKSAFDEVLDDETIRDHKNCERLVVCTGKIYYDLIEAREKANLPNEIPVVRCEQLYPFPSKNLRKVLGSYPNLKEVLWAQEEPINMGAWNFVRPRLRDIVKVSKGVTYVGRGGAGTTAEGSQKAHQKEQLRIVQEALGLNGATPTSAAAEF